MLKNTILDKFSKNGRLRDRMREITDDAAAGKMSRMDAGDLLGRQIVANLTSLARRTPEESRLLFEVQRERSMLYQQSNSATAVEAAESLIEAREALRETPSTVEDLATLVKPAWGILGDLVRIGSKRNAWAIVQILFEAVEQNPEFYGLKSKILDVFIELVQRHIADGTESGIMAPLIRFADYAKKEAPERVSELLALIPPLMAINVDEMKSDVAVGAFLYARTANVALDGRTLRHLAAKLIAEGKKDTEARQVYQEFLANALTYRAKLEKNFETLAYVSPDPDIRHDADLDSLNILLSEYYSDASWVWQNRALSFRKKGDPVGALACLGKAMTITGHPPELLGLMSPILHGLGFEYAAREFARFVPMEWHKRLYLNILDNLAEDAGSEERRRDLVSRFERALKQTDVPPEFVPTLRERRAQILFDVGELDRSERAWNEIREADPTNERAVVKLAEIRYRRGDTAGADTALHGRFSSAALPLVENLRSHLAESAGDYARAKEHNEVARAALAPAIELAGDKKMKFLVVLGDRIQRLFGDEIMGGPLLSMLQAEAATVRHRDYELLGPVLERRAVELSFRSGDTETAKRVIKELIQSHPADTDIYVHGLRASLRTGSVGEAEEFLASATSAGHASSAEVALLRGLMAWQKKDVAGARAAFEDAMAKVPTAEARLALAVIACGEQKEREALDLLSKARDEEGGTPEIRRRLYDLRGRLLERAGRRAEALTSYLVACEGADDGAEAVRRAGMLMIEQAIGPDGMAQDADAARRGILMLEGFNDPESVVHSALAKAAVEESHDQAATLLATALKRLSAKHAATIRLARLRRLAAAGDHAGMRDEVDALVEERDAQAADIQRTALELRRSLVRREAWSVLEKESAHPKHACRAAVEWLERDPTREAGSATAPSIETWLAALSDQGLATPSIDGKQSSPVWLAEAWGAFVRGTAVSAEDLAHAKTLASDGPDPLQTAAARLLVAAADPSAPASELLLAIDGARRAGVHPPTGESDLVRMAAARALATKDMAALEGAIQRGGEITADFAVLRRVLVMTEGEGAIDSSRLLSLLRELDAAMGPKGEGARGNTSRIATFQSRLTALREQPSPAWAAAKLRVAGKRARTYSPEVVRFWTEEIGAGRNVAEGLHVLALMALAHAHDAEANGNDPAAWHEAHAAWRALLDHEAFWTDVQAKIERAFPGVEKDVAVRVRAQVAQSIIRAHLLLAKSKMQEGATSTAIEHGRLAAGSPLTVGLDPRWREDLYGALAGDIERLVHWKRHEDALSSLDHVLIVDPSNPHARAETARVAAAAVGQALTVVDALTSPPAPSMVKEICALLSRVLVIAERPVSEMAKAPIADNGVAAAVVTTLRAMAYVAHHRDQNAVRASECLDLAIETAKSHGIETGVLVRLRTEIGLAKVERSIVGAKTAPTEAMKVDGTPSAGDVFETALTEVDRLLAFDPDNPKVITQKARLLIAKDRDAEAEQLARDLFKKAQKKAEPTTVRAAVELLHQVQAGRERFRYESKMQLIDRMVKDKNWRDAHALFKDATHGRQNELSHQRIEIEILLGLHRTEHLAELIPLFEKSGGPPDEAAYFRARFACLDTFVKDGGDPLSAFELYERGECARAVQIAAEAAARGDPKGHLHALLALAYQGMGDGASSRRHAKSARENAAKSKTTWVPILLSVLPETK